MNGIAILTNLGHLQARSRKSRCVVYGVHLQREEAIVKRLREAERRMKVLDENEEAKRLSGELGACEHIRGTVFRKLRAL